MAILLVLSNNIFLAQAIHLKTLVGNLLMLQDESFFLKPGTIVDTYGNTSLCSLSYEWWFYMLFIPVSNFKNKNRVVSIIIVLSSLLYFIYPIQLFRWLIYFWWSGVILADLYVLKELNFKNVLKTIMVPILSFPLVVLIFRSCNEQFISVGLYPVLEVRHFISAIIFITIALIWRKTNWIGYNLFKPLEKIAPSLMVFTFFIYQ